MKLKTLILTILLTLSFIPPALGDPNNWSVVDNRCPRSSDGFKRETGYVSNSTETYYWCYWYNYNTNTHNLSMRPAHIMGGFERSIPGGNQPNDYYKEILIGCAEQYMKDLGFCGWT